MNISVIIPALNEGSNIKDCIDAVKRLNPYEIIVVDGGSSDETCHLAQSCGAKVVKSAKGRGIQLQAGAAEAKGEILFFVHADALISKELEIIHLQSSINEGYAGGFLSLKFNDQSPSIFLVEVFANLRSRLFQLPYGDQAIFIKRDIFEELGGFKEYPFLEDLDFVMRVKKIGKLKYIPVNITVSARRLKKGYPLSPVIISLRNVFIAILFILGISPHKLINFYK